MGQLPYHPSAPAIGLWLRAKAVLALAAACAVAAPLAAQTTLLMPRAPLLPQHFAGWAQSSPDGSDAASPASGLPLLADPAFAAIVREDGMTRSAQASYGTAGEAKRVTVQAIEFSDATGAFAAYTALRRREMVDRPLGSGTRNNSNAAGLGGRTLLREGTSLVVLDGGGSQASSPASAVSTEELRALADTLPKVGGPKGFPPLLPTYLVDAGLVGGSVKYAVGPAAYSAGGGVLPAALLGFDKAGEAATGDYRGRGGSGKLTLLLLPTPQIAADRGRAIEGWLNSPEAKERSLGTVKLRRIGPMLALATGGFSAAEAATLVDGIHLRTELTWNKPMPPEFHVEVRRTASLLTSIMVFSGVGALAAVLLGSFLGFGRAWIRVLLGKPAASEPEFLRLDLRGGAGGDK